jgi:hypothetical protein
MKKIILSLFLVSSFYSSAQEVDFNQLKTLVEKTMTEGKWISSLTEYKGTNVQKKKLYKLAQDLNKSTLLKRYLKQLTQEQAQQEVQKLIMEIIKVEY